MYLIGVAIGAICGIIGTAFYFEAKYIDKFDKPTVHTLTIEIEEGSNEKDNTDSDATRWLKSWGS